MDFTNAEKTDTNTEYDNIEKFFTIVPYSDDNLEGFFEEVPYGEENLSTNLTYEYLSDDWQTDSDTDQNQTDMGSSKDMNGKDNKDDVYKIKKRSMKSKKQSCDNFSNFTMVKQNTEIANNHITENEMNCNDIVKSPEKVENNFRSSLSLTTPKRQLCSPRVYTRVFSRSASIRTSFPSKTNQIRKYHSSSFTCTGASNSFEVQDFRFKEFLKTSQQESVPLYKDHQLIGDSQLLRFAEQLLDMKKNVMYSPLDSSKSRRLGYCVSGQNLSELAKRLLEGEYKIHEKVIVLIGTNDILQRTKIKAMFESFEKILGILKKSANKIVFLTVPPVPKIHSVHVMKTLQNFNNFVMKKADGETIFAIDLSSHYMGYDNTIMTTYFESCFFDGRPDLIHLNKKGFKYLRAILNINYFDEFN